MKQGMLVGVIGLLSVVSALIFAQGKTEGPAVILKGGFETDRKDHGRPVVLIAAGLGVPTEVFREAFSHVRPAPAGQEPDPAQVRRNKEALLNALSKYGVTNERLDEVSNYYRYNQSRGEWWKYRLAKISAIVKDGKVTGFKVVGGGAGHSSVPKISVEGYPDLVATATVSYGKDLKTNGSISEVKLVAKK